MRQKRFLRCRWGWHSLGDSTQDRRGKWRTECVRCNALMCYSDRPFVVNGKITKP